jgi:hypothetical protein
MSSSTGSLRNSWEQQESFPGGKTLRWILDLVMYNIHWIGTVHRNWNWYHHQLSPTS